MKRKLSALLVAGAVAAAVIVPTSGSAGAAKTLQVRVVTATPITAGTWDPSQHAAYESIGKKYGWQIQIAAALPYGQATQTFDQWGAQGIPLVISTDNGFQSELLAAAAKYPKTKWVMMSALSTTNGLTNVAAYSANWCDIGFAQGVAGALISKTHKIAGVAGVTILPATQTIAAMKIGAAAAVPGTKVSSVFTNTETDTTTNTEATSTLLSHGNDVIIAVTNGGVSPAIAATVQAAHKWYIGSYGNESRFAPKATVTNALIEFLKGYQAVAAQMASGTFKNVVNVYGVKQGFVALSPFKLGFGSAGAKAAHILAEVKAGKFDAKLAKCSAIK